METATEAPERQTPTWTVLENSCHRVPCSLRLGAGLRSERGEEPPGEHELLLGGLLSERRQVPAGRSENVGLPPL